MPRTVLDKSIVSKPMLVIGGGSIGQRHLRNMKSLGLQRLAACDIDCQTLRALARDDITCFDDVGTALRDWQPHAVLVCTPPNSHTELAQQAIDDGAHLFIEKPLSNRLANIDALMSTAQRRQLVIQIGYNMMFHPAMRIIRAALNEKRLGRVHWARLEFGQYLPDWRPTQDYRNSYTARRSMGGGIIFDASHELHTMVSFFGIPKAITCSAARLSNLEMDAEDYATMICHYDDLRVHVQVDCLQREYTRQIKIVGDLGTLSWSEAQEAVHFYDAQARRMITTSCPCDINQTYIDELVHFTECIAQCATPDVTVADGFNVLNIALAAHESARSDVLVELYERGQHD